jgi:hypothetical protein
MANITKMVNDKEEVVFTAVNVRNVLNVEPLVEKACRDEIGSMCRRWTRRGVVVFARASVGTRAGKTVTAVFGNTTRWGRRKAEEFECVCHLAEYADMDKMEGHVCQPITPWLARRGIAGGYGWNAKTPCKPDRRLEVEKIREELMKCNARIWKKVMKGRTVAKTKGGTILKEEMKESFIRKIVFEERVKAVWDQNEKKWEGCVEENRLWEAKKVLNRLVNCPIDKHNAEAIAM